MGYQTQLFPLFISLCLTVVLKTNANDGDSTNGWKCGIFVSGAKGSAPRAKIFTIPHLFPTNCDNPQPEKYSSLCQSLMESNLDQWDLDKPSRKRPESGNSIGDELCITLSKDVPAPGIQFGFYYSFCNGQWTDTGVRRKDRLCCKDGKYIRC